jgi:hypothetical protein
MKIFINILIGIGAIVGFILSMSIIILGIYLTIRFLAPLVGLDPSTVLGIK